VRLILKCSIEYNYAESEQEARADSVHYLPPNLSVRKENAIASTYVVMAWRSMVSILPVHMITFTPNLHS
jgi:hypothetical protein